MRNPPKWCRKSRKYLRKLRYFDPRVDAQTRTAKVCIVVPNPGSLLRLGLYTDILFATPAALPVLTGPFGAIQSISPAKVVFVAAEREPGRFHQRTVKIGDETDTNVAFLKGLMPDE